MEETIMKIINGKELGFMPNGTVFSDIHDPDFLTSGSTYSMPININGLHIMCGHDPYFPESSGKFNGVLSMLDHIYSINTEIDEEMVRDDWKEPVDTDFNDYDENDYVVVYDKDEVENIIKKLQWALNGCK